MRALAASFELCAQKPELRMPTGYAIPRTFIYKHKSP
jgi:hypothetical protein